MGTNHTIYSCGYHRGKEEGGKGIYTIEKGREGKGRDGKGYTLNTYFQHLTVACWEKGSYLEADSQFSGIHSNTPLTTSKTQPIVY